MADETSLSLLQRLQHEPGDGSSWQRFMTLYQPWLRGWLMRLTRWPGAKTDIDDVLQDVFDVLLRKLPDFERRRIGAFRAWMKQILVNVLRSYHRDRHPIATGDSAFEKQLDELVDPNSELSQLWEKEYNDHLFQRLVEVARDQFEADTFAMFYELAIRGRTAADVAKQFSKTDNAVLLAKARVLRRLREEAQGLMD